MDVGSSGGAVPRKRMQPSCFLKKRVLFLHPFFYMIPVGS